MLEPHGTAGKTSASAKQSVQPCSWTVDARSIRGDRSRLKVRASHSGFCSNPQYRVAEATAAGQRLSIGCRGCLFATRHMRLVDAAGESTHIPRRVLGAAVARSPDFSAGNCKMSVTMRDPCEEAGENEEREKEEAAAAGCFAGVTEAEEGSDVDSDSELETEGDPPAEGDRPVSLSWGFLRQEWRGQAGAEWIGDPCPAEQGARPFVGHP